MTITRPLKDREDFVTYRASARQYGKTTGAIMWALGKAMQEPGVPVWMRDYPDNRRVRLYSKVKIIDIVEHLKLQNIHVYIEEGKLLIRSDNFGVLPEGLEPCSNAVNAKKNSKTTIWKTICRKLRLVTKTAKPTARNVGFTRRWKT